MNTWIASSAVAPTVAITGAASEMVVVYHASPIAASMMALGVCHT